MTSEAPRPAVRERGGWAPVIALGVVTITAYGGWFYAFGILIAPIQADTGWSSTALAAVFGGGQILMGLLAPSGGRLLDRLGGAGTFGVQAVLGAGLLYAATLATGQWTFGMLYALGAGVVGATGFYHVTTAAAARLGPGDPARSIAVLTAIGAFCSFIYLPVGQLLIDEYGWRSAARIFAVATAVGAVLAAIIARGGTSAQAAPGHDGIATGQASSRPIAAIRAAVANPAVRWMLIAYSFAGAAFASVLLFQVPAMTEVGIATGTAAFFAGMRGALQLLGRVGLVATVAKRGAHNALRVAYAVAGLASLFLLVNSIAAAAAYAVIVGIALGATSPLQAIHAQRIFPADDLGLLMGVQHSVFSIAGGIGPLALGLLHDRTDTHRPGVIMIAVSLVIAAVLLARSRPSGAIAPAGQPATPPS